MAGGSGQVMLVKVVVMMMVLVFGRAPTDEVHTMNVRQARGLLRRPVLVEVMVVMVVVATTTGHYLRGTLEGTCSCGCGSLPPLPPCLRDVRWLQVRRKGLLFGKDSPEELLPIVQDTAIDQEESPRDPNSH